MSQIDHSVQKIGNKGLASNEAPRLSMLKDHHPSLMLMKNAEVGNGKWLAIGVDEWIQAGRWWLMKVQRVNIYLGYFRRLIPMTIGILVPNQRSASDPGYSGSKLCQSHQGFVDSHRRYRQTPPTQSARRRCSVRGCGSCRSKCIPLTINLLLHD